MSGPRRKQQGRRRSGKPKPVDLWRPVPTLAEPAPIVPTTDPGMVIRSLGDPPLQGQGAGAQYTMERVVERAAMLAQALAATADLLATPADD
jgi:hypothetical protein